MGECRKVIAVIGTWLYEEKEFGFLWELNQMCRKKGYITVAFNLSVDSGNLDADVTCEKKLIDLMGHLKCDAVIVMGETIKSDRMLNHIIMTVQKMGVPVFAMERHIGGCINIAVRYGDGFKDIVRHVVVHHGCRKVNMLAGVKGNDFSDSRIRAYREVLEENGIPFEEKRLAYGEFWDRPARAAMELFLKEGELPEAIVCANDSMAITACEVLRDHGVRVPEDVIVTGFDGIESGRINIPSISTVAPDNQGEAELIFDLLERHDRGEIIDADKDYHLEFKVRERQSCGCGEAHDYLNVNVLAAALTDQKWHLYTLNRLLLFSGDMSSIRDLQPLLVECVELWMQSLYYVSIFERYMENSFAQPYGGSFDDRTGGYSCRGLFRVKDGKVVCAGESFMEDTLMPDLQEVFQVDSGYEMLMFRLLHTNKDVYGYLVEGFPTVDERSMKRCEELGLFLSTAIGTVLKNGRLKMLNEQLMQINREMERISLRDYLTDLYNRRGFYDELLKIVHEFGNRNQFLTFFSIDMDGLKVINDTYGHEEGDFAIKALASAVRHFAMRNGICARYGGDEFVCAIVTEIETSLTADIVRKRFQKVFDANDELQKRPYTISASVGLKCVRIDENLDLEEVMRHSDEAMYADKLNRRKGRA